MTKLEDLIISLRARYYRREYLELVRLEGHKERLPSEPEERMDASFNTITTRKETAIKPVVPTKKETP